MRIYGAGAGPGNFFPLTGAGVVSDGGTEPNEIVFIYDTRYDINTDAEFRFDANPLTPGVMTATLLLTIPAGLVEEHPDYQVGVRMVSTGDETWGYCGFAWTAYGLGLSSAGELGEVAGKDLLRPCFPNPFNPSTTIPFYVTEQGVVCLSVFDAAGRLVDVILGNETVNEGRNEAVWRGRDTAGRRVAAGVYFYRLEFGDYSETKRMVLVK
ncbi:MAG: T9SS type A sorting domain-containing protein [Krumholzibacteria bacterium]|nr:T9SS type A sorting domain-containing protein [Candidatus Krumholzibacteria bacterium]